MPQQTSRCQYLAQHIISLLVIFMFAVAWPIDLALQYNLGTKGAPAEAEVLQSWTARAKSGQTVFYSEVEFSVEGSTYSARVSGHEARPGTRVQIHYAPLWPGYVVRGSRPEPPAMATYVGRGVIGSFFTLFAIYLLVSVRQEQKSQQ